MSFQYDQYLEQHRANVKRAYEWISENLPKLTLDATSAGWQTIFAHDQSKNDPDEYEAYDAYFYGNNRSYNVVENYRRAWLLHIHRNPHHWQHWVLINDDPKEGEVALEMPYDYILEMICDWWSFSWQQEKPSEIFSWYDEHSAYMKLAPNTRKTVEDILGLIWDKLVEESDTLRHSGKKGMKWGVRNGPPYPIKDTGVVVTKQKHGIIKSTEIAREKFTKYALNPEKAPDKAKAFEAALGYTKDNANALIRNINEHFDASKLEERGDSGYGMRYQQIMRLSGPNKKEANVLTAWMDKGGGNLKLTSAYITRKEVSK